MTRKPFRSDADAHPRPSDHPGDPYGASGAKKVPNEKAPAEPAVGFGKPPVRSRSGDVQ